MSMDNRPPTVEWSRDCYGMDDTPAGPLFVRGIRHGRKIVFEPAEALPAGGLHAVAGGLTEKESWTRRIQTPLNSAAKALSVLPSMLDVQLPFGIEECAVRCVGLFRANGRGLTALAAAARLSDIRNKLDHWRDAGREPHALDQEGLALWTQACEECPPDPPGGARAAVYLGEDRIVLAFGRGLELISTHGLRHFEPEQVRRLARLAFEGETGPVAWLWTGPLADRSGTLAELRREMGKTAPFKDHVLPDPRTFLARAYAARALTPGPLRCDFRNSELVHPAVARIRKHGEIRAAAVCLAAGVIVLAAGLCWKGLLGRRQSEASRAVAVEARGVADLLDRGAAINPGYEMRSVSNVLAAAEPRYAPFIRAAAPSRSRSLGRMLMAARENNLVLYRLEWTGSVFRAEGRAPSASAIDAFARAARMETGDPALFPKNGKDEHGVRFFMETNRSR
jgi:hypothetical protein